MSRLLATALALAALVTAAPAGAGSESQHKVKNPVTIESFDGTKLVLTTFQPAGSGPGSPAPVIMHSHGWGGSRTQTITREFKAFLDKGFGIVSFDQRGFGASGGEANVQDPDFEGKDVQVLIDYIASLDWVAHNKDASGQPIPNDPMLGAIGGSYGGGYQTMGALTEVSTRGSTRFDALVPEITWYDLPESLAPQKVVRTAWASVLYAAGARDVPAYVHEGFAWGATTGQWPDGTVFGKPAPRVPDLDSEFHQHGPVYFVEKRIKLDIPMLLRQGSTDNLFNLNQGLDIFHKALTDKARKQSYFVAFNGGHALPNVAPRGAPSDAQLGGGIDACSGNWTAKRVRFFENVFSGASNDGLYPARYNFTTLDGKSCTLADRIDDKEADVETPGDILVSPTAAGPPAHYEIAQGPITLSGVPRLSGVVTNAGLDSRAFFGLAVGKTPADAVVIDNNLMPLRVIDPAVDRKFEIELPGVSAVIGDGQKLFLTVTPFSDMSFGHASRTPGALILSELAVTLPRPDLNGNNDSRGRSVRD